jgi:hypothetical protein
MVSELLISFFFNMFFYDLQEMNVWINEGYKIAIGNSVNSSIKVTFLPVLLCHEAGGDKTGLYKLLLCRLRNKHGRAGVDRSCCYGTASLNKELQAMYGEDYKIIREDVGDDPGGRAVLGVGLQQLGC